jgi:hypothetical protein
MNQTMYENYLAWPMTHFLKSDLLFFLFFQPTIKTTDGTVLPWNG